MTRFSYVIAGAAGAMALVIVGGYIFVRAGGISMETTAAPLPFEKSLAEMALVASVGNATAEQEQAEADSALQADVTTKEALIAVCGVCAGAPNSSAAACVRTPRPERVPLRSTELRIMNLPGSRQRLRRGGDGGSASNE